MKKWMIHPKASAWRGLAVDLARLVSHSSIMRHVFSDILEFGRHDVSISCFSSSGVKHNIVNVTPMAGAMLKAGISNGELTNQPHSMQRTFALSTIPTNTISQFLKASLIVMLPPVKCQNELHRPGRSPHL